MSLIQNILITGGNGQVAQALSSLLAPWEDLQLFFENRTNLPIDNEEVLRNWFSVNKPKFCINTAAYTAVDKAESDQENAYRINATAVGLLAKICAEYNTKLIHISTDYVFDGTSSEPLKEDAPTGPISVYGASKLAGEHAAREANPDVIIIRTAWVYSIFGNNFVKTMVRLMNERDHLNVVNDQIGAPTYAVDLAAAIQKIINDSAFQSHYWKPGIYHYSNTGKISWFDFAKAIAAIIEAKTTVEGIPTAAYPTPARRPAFSLLDTTKIQEVYQVQVPEWKQSLEKCLRLLTK
ncbi:dTDP-4-dehydrorhamnose reductase [Gynurincola endophyticus]|uniref:dTDP-4-dehydrorhamnose reductase n=1 Tax=Gynurincola endophyticus TaxID=2479004 RepID=UPI0018F394AF|nr:dTDP-4-dehydrorhamnose reductase [Gynurincola endophyticus]